jgi:hypothetical protein
MNTTPSSETLSILLPEPPPAPGRVVMRMTVSDAGLQRSQRRLALLMIWRRR